LNITGLMGLLSLDAFVSCYLLCESSIDKQLRSYANTSSYNSRSLQELFDEESYLIQYE